MKTAFKSLSALLCASLLLALTACGGGGGGDSFTPIAYTGATTRATISGANAADLAVLAYSGSSLGNVVPLANAAPVGTATRVPAPVLQGLSSLSRSLPGYVAQLSPPSAVSAAVRIQNETVPCMSGSMTMSGTMDQGAMNLDISFSACTQDGLVMNGEASMYISSNIVAADGSPFLAPPAIISMSMTYKNLSMAFVTGDSLTVYGTVGMTVNQAGAYDIVDLTMNMVMRDNVTGLTSKIENYHVRSTDYLSYEEINILSARVYDFYAGYVDISTPIPLEDDGAGQYPYFGILRLDGAGGSWAEVDFSIDPLVSDQGSWGDSLGQLGTFAL